MIRSSSKEKTLINNSSGVSEVIGAILLISVVVLAVAIIAAGLFSQPLPQKIPNVQFIPGINSNTNNLSIYHDGGESLYKGEYYVKINNERRDDYIITPNGGNILSVGKSLEFSPVPMGSTIQIFYYTGSGEVLLDQMQIQPSPTKMIPDVSVPPVPPCPTGCNISSCNQTEIRDAYTQIVVNTSTTFLRADSKTTLNNNGVLTFKVTNTSSTLAIQGKPLTYLYPGDIVTVSLDSSSKDFKAFGLGDKFYHLRGDSVDVSLVSVSNPSNNFNDKKTVLENGWITGYIDLGSTFTIDSPDPGPQSAYTLLVVNGTTIYNGYSRQKITISNIRPIGVGLFLLEEDSNSQEGVNFVGYGIVSIG